ncbi:unnamed protein product [Calicophoron daubneyi]|uniref:Microtubule-associated protein 9 n=1 Tax=Calicophoron daubneyi TaxID=300641 RepID=A0AAV2T1I4_CALDB
MDEEYLVHLLLNLIVPDLDCGNSDGVTGPKSVVPDELKSEGSGLTESLQYYEAQEVLPTVADTADEDMRGALPTADDKAGLDQIDNSGVSAPRLQNANEFRSGEHLTYRRQENSESEDGDNKSEADGDKPESFEDRVSGDAKRTPHPRFQRSTSANHLRDMQLIMDTKCENSYVSTVVLTSTEMNKMLDGKSPKDVAIISDSRRPPKSHSLRKRPSSCQSLQRLSTNYPVLPNRVVDGDTDGATIRAMAYQAWYARQARCARQERIASLQREAEDAKKQREELAKTEQNRKAFLSWKAQKRSYFREQLRRRKEEEEARQRKEDEQNRRKRESDHAFDVWKAQKDTILRKQQQNMQSKNRAQSDNKTYEESQKRAEAERAFQAWKTKKEAEIREANYQRHKHETDEEKKKSEEARKKSEQAAEAYYQWELRKLVELRDASGSSRGNLDTLKVASMECLRPGTAKGSSTERAPWRPSSSRPNSSTRLVI